MILLTAAINFIMTIIFWLIVAVLGLILGIVLLVVMVELIDGAWPKKED